MAIPSWKFLQEIASHTMLLVYSFCQFLVTVLHESYVVFDNILLIFKAAYKYDIKLQISHETYKWRN